MKLRQGLNWICPRNWIEKLALEDIGVEGEETFLVGAELFVQLAHVECATNTNQKCNSQVLMEISKMEDMRALESCEIEELDTWICWCVFCKRKSRWFGGSPLGMTDWWGLF